MTAAPRCAGLDELAGLPEAVVVVDGNDFLMLKRVRDTAATTAAFDQAIRILCRAFGTT